MSLFGETVQENTDINDEVLVNSMISSTTAGANAYLNAALISTAPELKAMYSSSLNQYLQGHAALTELAIKKGWEDPYDSPTQQLSNIYKKAKSTVKDDE